MSRRRRLFASVLLVGALAATLALIGSALSGRPVSLGAPQDQPGPVLLVPGFGGSAGSFRALETRLRAAGRDVTVVALPDGGTGDLAEQAQAVDTAATAALRRSGAPSVDLVGFSAGGVAIRLWVKDDGRDVVRRVVTLGTPHHGTGLAALAGSLGARLCPLACQQLAPGSELLRRLNAGDETPSGPQWLSVWTMTDQVVTPPSSARLTGAVDVPLQSVCPQSSVEHGQLPADPLVIGLVLRALTVEPIGPATAADCAGTQTV